MEQAALQDLPIVVIGAGPIGLAAAAHLVRRGETPLVLEAGAAVGASIRRWAHVRLFSPWRYLVDPVAREMLEGAGWQMPDGDRIPTGGELLERFLQPLADLPAIAGHIRFDSAVEAVSRLGFDKVKSMGREQAPFELIIRDGAGRRQRMLARAVIDASGTYTEPNPLGANGLPVEGEAENRTRIHYGIPDVLGTQRVRYVGKRVLVLGSGHSAFNALLDLAQLQYEEPTTEIVWGIRRDQEGQMFGGGSRDALPARGSLGLRLRRLVAGGRIRLQKGFRAERIADLDGTLLVKGGGIQIGLIDEIVVATGYRPNLAMTRELRLALDPWLEAPVELAPLIDPNVHSCGTVYPHGAVELAHPEAGFYTVGMKSYGRAPTFLLLTGYEQVRSVVCMLTGDEAGARQVQLVLPETGVCSTDLGGSCCSSGDSRALVGIGAAAAADAPQAVVDTEPVIDRTAAALPLVTLSRGSSCC